MLAALTGVNFCPVAGTYDDDLILDGGDAGDRPRRARPLAARPGSVRCPDHLVLGISAETFWEGFEGSKRLEALLQERAGVEVTLGSEACRAALRKFGGVKRLGI